MEGLHKVFKRSFLYQYSFILCIFLVLILFISNVNALSIPYTFNPGDPIKSSEVNENFKFLADRSWELTDPNSTDSIYFDGYVGIGTDNPQTLLHVGSLDDELAHYIRVQSSNRSGIQLKGSGQNMWEIIYDSVYSHFQIISNANDFITIDNTGKVGIGLIEPTVELQVSGTIKADYLEGDGSGLTGITATAVEETDPTVLESVKDGISWSEIADIPVGFADGSDDVEIMTEIDPTVPESVKDGISWSEIIGIPAGFADGSDDVGITTETDPKVGSNVMNTIPKWDGNQLVDSSAIFEDESGNVGIGTSSPKYHLHVHGDSSTDATMLLSSDANSGIGINPNFLFIGDANGERKIGGIGFDTSNDVLKIVYGETFQENPNCIAIDPNGNVGIGTTNPFYKLHVDGDIYANGTIYGLNNTVDSDWTESGGNVYRETGNVGIGTTSPATPLHINGTGNGSIGTLHINRGDSAKQYIVLQENALDAGVIGLTYKGMTGLAMGLGGHFTNGTPDYLAFTNINGSELAVITENGNVGIGTTSPSEKLEINGTVKATTFKGDGSGLINISGTADSDWTESGGNVYRETGNVGIGTTTPGVKLHVSTTSFFPARFESTSNWTTAVEWKNNGGEVWELAVGGTTLGDRANNFYIWNQNDQATHLLIESTTGNVGIGTTSPTQKLSVEGVVESTTGGFKFPDGTTQTTAASGGTGDGYSLDAADGDPVDVVYIDNEGNVVIGTTSPASELLVEGKIRINKGADIGKSMLQLTSEGSVFASIAGFPNEELHIKTMQSTNLHLCTNNQSRMVVDSVGNIGIGTTSPNEKLTVEGVISLNKLLSSPLDTSGYGKLFVKSIDSKLYYRNDSGTEYDLTSTSGGDNLGDHMATQNIILNDHCLSGDGGNEGIRVDASGNVGIGTPSPGHYSKLFIDGAIPLNLEPAGRTAIKFNLYYDTGTSKNRYIKNGPGGAISFDNGDFIFGTCPYGTAGEIQSDGIDCLFFANTGNVGVGTRSPVEKLDVTGTAKMTGFILPTGATNGYVLTSDGSGVGTWQQITNAPDNDWAISGNDMYSVVSGNVGIGTTSPEPGTSLHVVGGHPCFERNSHKLYINPDFGPFGTHASIYTHENLRLHLGTNNDPDKLVIDTTGNVSIGTTNPTYKFEVIDNQGLSSGEHFIAGFGQHPEDILLGYRADGTQVTGGLVRAGNGKSLFLGTSPATQAVTILNNGNVGIGTISPGTSDQQYAKFVVKKDSADVESNTIGIGLMINRINSEIGAIGFGADNQDKPILAMNNEDLRIGSFGQNDFTELVRIEKYGNVGIGTTGPQHILHVSGVSAWIANITNSNTDGRLLIGSTQTGGASIQAQKVSVQGSGHLLLNENGGNVGIGTTSPQGTLDVNGTIYQSGSQLHADYVFEPEYKLESIEEHAKYMWSNMHLKAIPKAKVDKDGKEIVEVGAHRKGIVEELEKAHIYIEQLHKQITVMEKDNREMKKHNKEMEERLTKLETMLNKQ